MGARVGMSVKAARGGRWRRAGNGPSRRGRAMLQVTSAIAIPETEFTWSFVRSGGPGGQNVNKVASKAVLRWPVVASASLPEHVKARLIALYRRRVTTEGDLVL